MMGGGGIYSVSCKVGTIKEKAHLKHKNVIIKSLNDGGGGYLQNRILCNQNLS